jgi:hypothetical protein
LPYPKACPATPALNTPASAPAAPASDPAAPASDPAAPASTHEICTVGQIYDAYSSTCKDSCSAQEFHDSINHQCKKTCSSTQILDTLKNKCLARNRCQPNEFWDSSAQACSSSFFSLKAQSKPTGPTLTYSVNFRNDAKISLSAPLTATNLKTYTRISLEGLTEPEDYTSAIKYSETTQKIAIEITVVKDVSKGTVLSVFFLSPEKLAVEPNFQPNLQTEASAEFQNVSVGELEALELLQPMVAALGASANNAMAAAGVSIVLIGISTGGGNFLISFINVVECFSLYIFFNVRYSFLIDAVLSAIFNALNSPFIPNPFNEYNADDRDLARVFKYKLTVMEIPPWFFQDSNIEIWPIILVYFLTI